MGTSRRGAGGQARCDVARQGHDVRSADLDLTSVTLSKRNGNLIVRFMVRGAITDDVSYTADIATGLAWARVVARRVSGKDSFVVSGAGRMGDVTGEIRGRTATVTAPVSSFRAVGGGTLVRVRAYFWSVPAGNRKGMGDTAPDIGAAQTPSGIVWFCLSDLHPRPNFGPCLWPTAT